jgi:hypothetical protein
MANDVLLDFEWHTAGPGGYVWEAEWRNPDLHAIGMPTPIPEGLPPGPYVFRRAAAPIRIYHPLRDEPQLFRIFAATEPTPAGILAFMEQYGFLGGRVELKFMRHLRMPGGLSLALETITVRRGAHLPELAAASRAPDRAEALGAWQNEIGLLRCYVEMWEQNNADMQMSAQERRVRMQQLIDDVNTFTNNIGTAWHLRLRPDNTIEQCYAPLSLLAAMWYQFSTAIAEGRRYPPCKTCGRPFEISRDRVTGKRRHAEFCSKECKHRDFRRRRTLARGLRRDGLTPQVIATRVGSTTAVVQRWVRGITPRPTH